MNYKIMFSGSVTILFSTECLPYYEWQSIGLKYSFIRSKQNGKLVRLMACDENEQYNSNTQKVDTFVHENMRMSSFVKHQGFPSYNKPYSFMNYMGNVSDVSEYIIMMESDMVIHQPINPKRLGVRPGVVFSSQHNYLIGADNNFKTRFLVTDNPVDKVGGIYIFHKEDAKKIAPLWFAYTKKVKDFMVEYPEIYLQETIENYDSVTRNEKKQAEWRCELYGYIFAASHLGIKHIISNDFLTYAGYNPIHQKVPSVIHYGIDFGVGEYSFQKMKHTNLNIKKCNNILFDNGHITSDSSKKDLVAIGTIDYLNGALCNYYESECNYKCDNNHIEKINNDINYIKNTWNCIDEHSECVNWTNNGECNSNPLFMNNVCTNSCGLCKKNIDTRANYIIIGSFIFILVLVIQFFNRIYKDDKENDKHHIV
jgi:peptidyl serine alpha-galactosyltransferase